MSWLSLHASKHGTHLAFQAHDSSSGFQQPELTVMSNTSFVHSVLPEMPAVFFPFQSAH